MSAAAEFMRPVIIASSLVIAITEIANGNSQFQPQPVGEGDFDNVIQHSPFLRPVRFKDNYSLRAIATVSGESYILLRHRETKEMIMVGPDGGNDLGLSLLSVDGSTPRDTVVKVAFGGSEIEFAYEESVVQPKITIPGTRDKIRRDREGRVITSDELVKKWQNLSKEQRAAYDRWKDQLLRARPDLRYSEKRFPIAHQALDAFKAGRQPPRFPTR
ncbi:MAG: hypothetical protein AAF585_08970 [Verrucomicrobiota bacterium]